MPSKRDTRGVCGVGSAWRSRKQAISQHIRRGYRLRSQPTLTLRITVTLSSRHHGFHWQNEWTSLAGLGRSDFPFASPQPDPCERHRLPWFSTHKSVNTATKATGMRDFTDELKPAGPGGPAILAKEREQSDVPIDELSRHLLSRNNFLERQERVLRILEKDPLFSKSKQQNLSRPERYHLGLARAKKLRRLQDKHGWDEEDQAMGQYLCDDVSPYMVHYAMYVNPSGPYTQCD